MTIHPAEDDRKYWNARNFSSKMNEKIEWATVVLRQCIGIQGVWADHSRYRGQCWTRDFVLAIMPMLLQEGKEDSAIGDRTAIVRTHLENLSKRQRGNGQIPILFLDKTIPFLWNKIKKSVRDLKISFMLKRFLLGQLWNLTPGTRDSEILYIIGMHEYARQTGDASLLKQYQTNLRTALQYIENKLMRDGLVIGCDWRDTMEKKLGDKPLLTNNCLLVHAYRLMGEKDKAEALRARINDQFWVDGSYIDYPGNNRFDPLGGSFTILYDVAPLERHASLVASFRSVDSDHGVTIKCRHNPFSPEEREVIERTDGVVVWPFIVGFSILALLKINARLLAEAQFQKLVQLMWFQEWYDPATGNGYGSTEQLWSATLFYRAAVARFKRQEAKKA